MEQPKEQDAMGPLLHGEGDVGEQVPAQKGRDGAELVPLSAARRCQDPQRDREGVRIQGHPRGRGHGGRPAADASAGRVMGKSAQAYPEGEGIPGCPQRGIRTCINQKMDSAAETQIE